MLQVQLYGVRRSMKQNSFIHWHFEKGIRGISYWLLKELFKRWVHLKSLAKLIYEKFIFGISCAPEIFQKIIHQVYAEILGLIEFMNDIVIYGENKKEFLTKTEKLGFTLNKAKRKREYWIFRKWNF